MIKKSSEYHSIAWLKWGVSRIQQIMPDTGEYIKKKLKEDMKATNGFLHGLDFIAVVSRLAAASKALPQFEEELLSHCKTLSSFIHGSEGFCNSMIAGNNNSSDFLQRKLLAVLNESSSAILQDAEAFDFVLFELLLATRDNLSILECLFPIFERRRHLAISHERWRLESPISKELAKQMYKLQFEYYGDKGVSLI